MSGNGPRGALTTQANEDSRPRPDCLHPSRNRLPTARTESSTLEGKIDCSKFESDLVEVCLHLSLTISERTLFLNRGP